MNCGVVIVTYNRLELLKECIDCVLAQSVPFSKIVIVNNCSTDATGAYLTKYESDKRFVILSEKENLGGAGGFAVGMEEIQKLNLDWILLIDDDAMLSHDYVQILTEQTPEDYAAAAGAVYTDSKVDITHRRRISSKLLFLEKAVSLLEYESDSFICDCATFCGLMIRGKVAKEIGLPKAEYFLWYDDSEYCLRLKNMGGVYTIPAAKLNHKTKLIENGQGLLDRTTWRHYYGYRNRLDCGKKHFGKLTGVMITLQYMAFYIISLFMCLNKSKKEHAKFNLLMLKNVILDGNASDLGKSKLFHP